MSKAQEAPTVTHTPTPWRAKGLSVERDLVDADGKRTSVAICTPSGREEGLSYANAAHIVRCCNAWDDVVALRARVAELEATR